jgi:restriction endonuclease Mrr
VASSEHNNSDSAADNSSMKKPKSALSSNFGHLTFKQRLANFHTKLKKGGLFESQANPTDQSVFFDTQYVAEHATHIYEHCLATQHLGAVDPMYMSKQYDINS